jgi:nucleoside-diphosphate-sugar epimerase
VRRVVFGAGYVGARVAALAASRGDEVVATVRTAQLESNTFRVTRAPVLEVARREAAGAHAIICFPPDEATDAALASLLREALAVSYVSSTSVYGEASGGVDDSTPVAGPSGWLTAEAAYRAVGGTVLRAPGIYGPDRGLHVRVTSGQHQLPGEAGGVMSRVHADDLAELLLASVAVRGETFVVGDLEPAAQRETVEWVCAEWGCALPPTVEPAQVPASLRRDRRVDASRALRVLGVTLRYPSFRVGMRRR